MLSFHVKLSRQTNEQIDERTDRSFDAGYKKSSNNKRYSMKQLTV